MVIYTESHGVALLYPFRFPGLGRIDARSDFTRVVPPELDRRVELGHFSSHHLSKFVRSKHRGFC